MAESNASYEVISSKVDEFERIVELSKYSGDSGSEGRLVRHFVTEGRTHPLLAVAQAILFVFKDKDFTICALRDAVKENVPRALRTSNESYFTRIANLVKAQTFMTVLN